MLNGDYSVLAINDLGMHCGDLDTRIASILPPFQVLLAQVIRKGADPTLNPDGVIIEYSAAANPADPVLLQAGIDPGIKLDLPAWCKANRQRLLALAEERGDDGRLFRATIMKMGERA